MFQISPFLSSKHPQKGREDAFSSLKGHLDRMGRGCLEPHGKWHQIMIVCVAC